MHYDGKPAPDVAVLFEPKSDAKLVPNPGFAVTDSNGRFKLTSLAVKAKSGIEPGTYTLYLGWKNPNEVDGALTEAEGGAKPVPSPYRFPEKLTEGKVVVAVKETGKNHFVFRTTVDDVTWDE
ncbi:MAG: hypothetical protein LBN39_10365 [Planctomycetaceae bacterium]|nr:hypothetical protein [Planctomycetaceae bacterium]